MFFEDVVYFVNVSFYKSDRKRFFKERSTGNSISINYGIRNSLARSIRAMEGKISSTIAQPWESKLEKKARIRGLVNKFILINLP